MILSSTSYLVGQMPNNQTNSPWSLSLSYAPKFEIRRPLNRNSRMFFKSINIMTDYRIKNRFSFSFGLDYCQNTKTSTSLHFGGDNPPISYFLFRTSFTEFPLQLNFHLIEDSKRLDPFIKTSLRNVYYHSYFRRESSEVFYTLNSDHYYLFCDFGLGSYFKIKDKLSFIFQSSIGFGLKYHTPQYTYFEGLVGLRYTMTKFTDKSNRQSGSF